MKLRRLQTLATRIRHIPARTWIGLLAIIVLFGALSYHARRQCRLDQVLIEANWKNDTAAALNALNQGADPNARIIDANTPDAHWTLGETFRWTIQVHRNLNWHSTPILCEAADFGDPRLVKILLDRGADINASDQNGKTALMCATGNGNGYLVSLLLKRGANVNARDRDGMTALLITKAQNRPVIGEILIKAGAADEPLPENYPHFIVTN